MEQWHMAYTLEISLRYHSIFIRLFFEGCYPPSPLMAILTHLFFDYSMKSAPMSHKINPLFLIVGKNAEFLVNLSFVFGEICL